MRMTLLIACITFALGPAALGQQPVKVPATAPRPAANVTALRTHPNRARMERPRAQGVVEGFVYWDASLIKHLPPNSCSGLSVTVSAGGTLLVTMTDNFAYMGNVGGNALCRYAVKGLPIERELQVQANVASPAALSPVAVPGGGSKSITLTTGAPGCFFGGPLTPSPSELLWDWSSCDYIASNVNFILVRAPLSSRLAGPVRVAPGKAVELSPQPYPPKSRVSSAGQANEAELSPQPYPPKNGTLLTLGAQHTMLGTRANSAQGPGMGSPSGSRANPTINAGRAATQSNLATGNLAKTHPSVTIQEDPKIYAAQACAQDPTMGLIVIIDNSNGVVLYPPRSTPCRKGYSCQSGGNLYLGPTEAEEMATARHQFTLLGCSFGKGFDVGVSTPLNINNLQPTLPASAKSNKRVYIQQNAGEYDLAIKSWSDNSIVVISVDLPYPEVEYPDYFVVKRDDGEFVAVQF